MNPTHTDLLARLAPQRIHLPDLAERQSLPGLVTQPPKVVALLAAGWGIMVVIQFAQFWGLV